MSDGLSIIDMMFLRGDIDLYGWILYSIIIPAIILLVIFGIFMLYDYWYDIKRWFKRKFKK